VEREEECQMSKGPFSIKEFAEMDGRMLNDKMLSVIGKAVVKRLGRSRNAEKKPEGKYVVNVYDLADRPVIQQVFKEELEKKTKLAKKIKSVKQYVDIKFQPVFIFRFL
jgi:hypothetical protein